MVSYVYFIVLAPVAVYLYWVFKLWLHIYKTYHHSFTGLFVTRWELAIGIFKNMHPQDKTYTSYRKKYRLSLLATLVTLIILYLARPFL